MPNGVTIGIAESGHVAGRGFGQLLVEQFHLRINGDALFGEADDDAPRFLAVDVQSGSGVAVQQLDGNRSAHGIVHPVERWANRGGVGAEGDNRLCFGNWGNFQGGLGENAQSAERSDVEFHQVVTGHVLDDSSAGVDCHPTVSEELYADEEVTQGAVAVTSWAADVGGEDAAEGHGGGIGNVDRQMLIFLLQGLLQGLDCHPGLHGDRHVAGGVIDDLVQLTKIDDVARFQRRVAVVKLRPAADGENRLRGSDNLGQLLDGVGLALGRHRHVVDCRGLTHGMALGRLIHIL